jgi:hypothetical protein
VALITSSEPEINSNNQQHYFFARSLHDHDLEENLDSDELFGDFKLMTFLYENATKGPPKFDLRVQDFLSGLSRGKASDGWISARTDSIRQNTTWYKQLDYILNADLHKNVLGNFITMHRPRDMPDIALLRDVAREDGAFCHRDSLSPAHYTDFLAKFDVQAVIPCNAPQTWSRAGFEAAGIAVVELEKKDCE